MDTVTTDTFDKHIPVTPEGDNIEWDGNLATILGTIAQVDEWHGRRKRRGKEQRRKENEAHGSSGNAT